MRDDWDQFLRDRPAVRVGPIGQQPAGECVRAGDAGFESGIDPGQALEAFEIIDRAQAFGCFDWATDFVFTTLVVGRWAEPARRSTLKFDALEEAVKRQVEVEPRLLTVGYHVEPGGELIIDGGDDSIIDHLLAVSIAELLEALAGELKPAGEGVAADDGRAKRLLFHGKGIQAALGGDFKLGA